MAVQVRADGEVTYVVNRQPAGVNPVLLRNEPGDRWRVRVTGAAVETDLLVRRLVVWEGTRYDASGGAASGGSGTGG